MTKTNGAVHPGQRGQFKGRPFLVLRAYQDHVTVAFDDRVRFHGGGEGSMSIRRCRRLCGARKKKGGAVMITTFKRISLDTPYRAHFVMVKTNHVMVKVSSTAAMSCRAPRNDSMITIDPETEVITDPVLLGEAR